MSGWALFGFWGYVVAVALFLLGAAIISVRAFHSQGRDRRLLLVATALTVFSALLISVFYFTNPYR